MKPFEYEIANKLLSFVTKTGGSLSTHAVLFTEPVDTKAYPDYLAIIEKPMCYQLIKSKLGKSCDDTSYADLEDFVADMRLISTNVMKYDLKFKGVKKSHYESGEFLLGKVNAKLKELIDKQQMSTASGKAPRLTSAGSTSGAATSSGASKSDSSKKRKGSMTSITVSSVALLDKADDAPGAVVKKSGKKSDASATAGTVSGAPPSKKARIASGDSGVSTMSPPPAPSSMTPKSTGSGDLGMGPADAKQMRAFLFQVSKVTRGVASAQICLKPRDVLPPDYLLYVPDPISMKDVSSRLQVESVYATNTRLFFRDMCRVFTNELRYNCDPTFPEASKIRTEIFDVLEKVEVICSGSTIPPWRLECREMLTSLLMIRDPIDGESQRAALFTYPVPRESCPDYDDEIRRPMDLGTLCENLEVGDYTTPNDFIADLKLVFTNCIAYWKPRDDPAYLCPLATDFLDRINALVALANPRMEASVKINSLNTSYHGVSSWDTLAPPPSISAGASGGKKATQPVIKRRDSKSSVDTGPKKRKLSKAVVEVKAPISDDEKLFEDDEGVALDFDAVMASKPSIIAPVFTARADADDVSTESSALKKLINSKVYSDEAITDRLVKLLNATKSLTYEHNGEFYPTAMNFLEPLASIGDDFMRVYKQYVPNPMDLDVISKNLAAGKYSSKKTREGIKRDILLMVENCLVYNAEPLAKRQDRADSARVLRTEAGYLKDGFMRLWDEMMGAEEMEVEMIKIKFKEEKRKLSEKSARQSDKSRSKADLYDLNTVDAKSSSSLARPSSFAKSPRVDSAAVTAANAAVADANKAIEGFKPSYPKKLKVLLNKTITKSIYNHMTPYVENGKTKKGQTFNFMIDRIPESHHLAPAYYGTIKNPIFIRDMKTKVDEDKYLTLDQFTADIELAVSNALTFNEDVPRNAGVRTVARLLQSQYHDVWKPDMERQLAEVQAKDTERLNALKAQLVGLQDQQREQTSNSSAIMRAVRNFVPLTEDFDVNDDEAMGGGMNDNSFSSIMNVFDDDVEAGVAARQSLHYDNPNSFLLNFVGSSYSGDTGHAESMTASKGKRPKKIKKARTSSVEFEPSVDFGSDFKTGSVFDNASVVYSETGSFSGSTKKRKLSSVAGRSVGDSSEVGGGKAIRKQQKLSVADLSAHFDVASLPPKAKAVHEDLMGILNKFSGDAVYSVYYDRPVIEKHPEVADAYLEVIAKPMDLYSLQRKLELGHYVTAQPFAMAPTSPYDVPEDKGINTEAFFADLKLIYENAILYNELTHGDDLVLKASRFFLTFCQYHWSETEYFLKNHSVEEREAIRAERMATLSAQKLLRKSALTRLMKKLQGQKNQKDYVVSEFKEYVNATHFPTYPDFLKSINSEPTCLKVIDAKLADDKHGYPTVNEFLEELRRVFTNAIQYDKGNAGKKGPTGILSVHDSAEKLLEQVNSMWIESTSVQYFFDQGRNSLEMIRNADAIKFKEEQRALKEAEAARHLEQQRKYDEEQKQMQAKLLEDFNRNDDAADDLDDEGRNDDPDYQKGAVSRLVPTRKKRVDATYAFEDSSAKDDHRKATDAASMKTALQSKRVEWKELKEKREQRVKAAVKASSKVDRTHSKDIQEAIALMRQSGMSVSSLGYRGLPLKYTQAVADLKSSTAMTLESPSHQARLALPLSPVRQLSLKDSRALVEATADAEMVDFKNWEYGELEIKSVRPPSGDDETLTPDAADIQNLSMSGKQTGRAEFVLPSKLPGKSGYPLAGFSIGVVISVSPVQFETRMLKFIKVSLASEGDVDAVAEYLSKHVSIRCHSGASTLDSNRLETLKEEVMDAVLTISEGDFGLLCHPNPHKLFELQKKFRALVDQPFSWIPAEGVYATRVPLGQQLVKGSLTTLQYMGSADFALQLSFDGENKIFK